MNHWKGYLALAMSVTSLGLPVDRASAQQTYDRIATRAHPTRNAAFQRSLESGEAVDIAVVLKLRNRDKLDAAVKSITTPGDPRYHRWLGRQDIEADYAPTQSDAAIVAQYLAKAGFAGIQISSNRLLVTATGNAAAIRKAFRTEMGHFSRDGREGIANLHDVELPSSLSGGVLAVLGLQTLDQMHPTIRPADQVMLTGSVHGMNPTSFPIAYNASGLATASATTVGIITEGSMTQTVADLHQFESQNGLSTINPVVVRVGAASSDTANTVEWDLDSQTIQAMAGGQVASMYFYAAHSLSDADIHSAINKAVTDNLATVINVSLGICESSAHADGSMASNDQILQVAVAQGQTFAVSTGDSGSKECTNSGGTAIAGASYPASSPYVIAVGGTTLYTDASGHYGGETVWSGTGGSPSLLEPKPAWQNGVVAGAFRGLPDVAFDADPASGAIIILNGQSAQYGGTSLATPIFVGSWARIQSTNQARLGFPATWIYSRGVQMPPAFHDITSGSNGDYSAGTGWDYTTGFGSFDVAATALLTRSSVTIGASPAIITPGQSVTLTATVAGNSPTGSVQFLLNGANLGSPVNLVNGIATLTTTSITLIGTDVISAVYSGDSNNAGGTSATPFAETVVSDNGDVPMPKWAILLAAALLLASTARTRC